MTKNIQMQAAPLCSLCPTTDQQRARLPPPPELEGAPMSDLRCGHQVHTHCLLNKMHLTRQNSTCEECQVTIMREEEIEFYREIYDDYNRVARQTIGTLWADNEEFRNDVKEYKKLGSKLTRMQRMYSKDAKVVKNKFKENVLTSIELIKDQKRLATSELTALESRKNFRRAGLAVLHKLNYFRRKWDVSSWALRELNDIEGAPKISRSMVYYRWHSSPKYIFRLKL